MCNYVANRLQLQACNLYRVDTEVQNIYDFPTKSSQERKAPSLWLKERSKELKEDGIAKGLEFCLNLRV